MENGGTLEECTDFENNCEQIAAQLADTDFENKIEFLKGKTNEELETGFMQITNGAFINLPVVNGGHSLDLPDPIPTNMMGFLHTHIDYYENGKFDEMGNPQLIKPIKMFSPKDIKMFLKLVANATSNNIDVSGIYAVMVSSGGTYMLRFNGDVNNINANFNPVALSETFIKYFDDYNSKERAFLNFLNNEINGVGTSLYKINNNGTVKRKFLKPNGTVGSENCPD